MTTTIADLMEALTGFDPDDLAFVKIGDRLRQIHISACKVQSEDWGDWIEWDVAEENDESAPHAVLLGDDGTFKVGP